MEYLSEVQKKVQENVILSNNELVVESKQYGATIYGNMTVFLENQSDAIDELAEKVGTHLAYKKGIELTQEYEKNSTFFEKYIHNDPLKLKKFEEERKMKSEMIIGGTQIIIKGGVYITKKIFTYLDKKHMTESVWNLCMVYANTITKREYADFTEVEGLLGHISKQLFGKIKRDYLNGVEDKIEYMVLPNEEYQIRNVSLLLYLIYAQKHLASYRYDEKEDDMNELFKCWALLGIFRGEAVSLFEKYEQLQVVNMYDYGRLNTVTQNIYNNLYVTLLNFPTSKSGVNT